MKNRLELQLNTNKAKNVIIFIGDGMGINTHTGARIYKGQKNGKSGEEEVSVFILAESNAERASVHSFALLDTFHNTHSLGARQEKLCVHACRVLKTKNCKSHSA